MSAFEGLSRVAQFGIKPFGQWKNASRAPDFKLTIWLTSIDRQAALQNE